MAGKGRVLITGANGYIAARTVEAFLKAGYSVRGTVRSKTTAQSLVDALSKNGDKFELVEVPDIIVPGAFDEAVKGVDAVAHLAAPVALNFTDPEPVIRDAIGGILRALESASKEASIKSFVFMSSIVAVASAKDEDYTFTEADWNTQAGGLVEKLGKDAPDPVIYSASKTAAEKAMWKFRDEHHPNFTLTAINPCFVAGPPLVAPSSLDKVNITTKNISDVFAGVPLDQAGIPGSHHIFVDIRDVARAVVFAVDHLEKTNNERFILASFASPQQAVANILRKAFPERAHIIEEGTPGEGYLPGYAFPKHRVYDGTKITRVTGQDYISWEKTVVDAAEMFKRLV
ncbi:hypothetical protein C8A00DRAFT_18189 [Chaetomidium leptoderma]|uniref:NAD-dependent epimerase/dehydratase domain-containing protein n=1 Tax=Chaetomidium leptoderma TaxID=669021 RepID=A0AAN6ZU74_9PEZI|nr:hypothetical protein C8A00DRAFT_18189 [Chaetomidium leptoderma]